MQRRHGDEAGQSAGVGGMTDVGFFHAVVRAGRAFVAAKGKDPAKEGVALAELLRAGCPLGPGERDLLADLVTGEWRDRPGRKDVRPGNQAVVDVVAELRRLEGEGCKKEAAKVQVAADFGISRATVENYEKMTNEREAAKRQAESLVRNPLPPNK